MVAVFASRYGLTIDQPVTGSTMPKTQIDFRPIFLPVGRDCLAAHTDVNVPCCPGPASRLVSEFGRMFPSWK